MLFDHKSNGTVPSVGLTLASISLVLVVSIHQTAAQFNATPIDYYSDVDLILQRETAAQLTTTDESECFEDRLEAIEVGRQCSRRCKKDVPCENARKQCLCDGLCGLSCLKPDLNCLELSKIEHGDYQPKSTRFNTRVVYQCDPGFYLFGSRERLCQGDEDWSGTPAECLAEREYGRVRGA